MKKKRFSVEQIVAVMKQAEAGVPVAELIRKVFPRNIGTMEIYPLTMQWPWTAPNDNHSELVVSWRLQRPRAHRGDLLKFGGIRRGLISLPTSP